MPKLVGLSVRVSKEIADKLRGLVARRLASDPRASLRTEIERLVVREVKRVERYDGAALRRVRKLNPGRRPKK